MYSHTLVKVSVTVAVTVFVTGGVEGSQADNALEVSWPRLGATNVSLCPSCATVDDSRHDVRICGTKALLKRTRCLCEPSEAQRSEFGSEGYSNGGFSSLLR